MSLMVSACGAVGARAGGQFGRAASFQSQG